MICDAPTQYKHNAAHAPRKQGSGNPGALLGGNKPRSDAAPKRGNPPRDTRRGD